MCEIKRTPAAAALTNLSLDLFRLNNRLLASGDRLVADLGLTSARWQVLGTIVAAEQPQPVAWIARDMGSKRQNIQRIVNDLEKNGHITFERNPHHRRAPLVVLTDKGKDAFTSAMKLQAPWYNDLTDGLTLNDIDVTNRTIRLLLKKLGEDID